MRAIAATVVTADHFAHWIPIWSYTLHRATGHPGVVFVRGYVDELVQEALAVANTDLYLIEGKYTEYPFHKSTTNCLRFLDKHDLFSAYDWVYWTDIDFAFLLHEPDFFTYYAQKATDWGEDYWSRRGPKRASGTDEKAKRIAGGCMMVRIPEWYVRTEEMREKMRKKVMSGEIGKYREDDERMLWDICAGSGMKCPTKRKNKRQKKYKEVHLGDFKFDHRWTSNRKMKKRISLGNYEKWFRLQEDETWQRIRTICEQDDQIKQILHNVNEYMEARHGGSSVDSTALQA